MKLWPDHDASARFGELLEKCLSEGPQVVTKHGARVAVLVPIIEWQRLQHSAGPSLKDLLLAETPRAEFELRERGRPVGDGLRLWLD